MANAPMAAVAVAGKTRLNGLTTMLTVETPAPALAADDTPRLTGRLAVGDEAAFQQFHELYFDRLYEFILVLSHGEVADAQEILQQTLLRVARYARPFPDGDIFWRWLKMAARSAARDAGRKQYRYLNLLRNYTLRWLPIREAGKATTETDLGDLLAEELWALNRDDRHLLEGKYLQGFSVRELAAETGLTEKAVESRLLRLRRELRERLLRKLHRS